MDAHLERYQAIDGASISAWIAGRQQEDLHLEFKTIANGSNVTRDDRKNFAIALSGFANSDGGIVVWGVEASRDQDGVDAASALAPIPNVEACLSTLQSLTAQATSPLVDSVQNRIVFVNGSGVIVTYVPASDGGPHMALMGEGRYFKRSGDSFRRMEHFDVADMFGRRVRPRLELVVTMAAYGFRSGAQRGANLHPVLSLRNSGRGIAKHPYLQIAVAPPFKVDPTGLGSGAPGLPRVPRRNDLRLPAVFVGGVNDVILPGTERDIVQLAGQVVEGESIAPLRISYAVGAEGLALVEGEHTIDSAQIDAALQAQLAKL